MPKINRYRFIAIPYGVKGEKNWISDLIIEPEEQHLLYNLQNRGGKGVALLLLLQSVLPKEKMSAKGGDPERENSLTRIVNHSDFTTGHVLVEWALDTDDEKYLLTGVCFTGKKDENRGIKYPVVFCYTNEYSSMDDPMGLENIPIVENGKSKSYSRWRNKLKDLEKQYPRLEYYNYEDSDKKKSYQNKLISYNIFPEEWLNIKKINSAEGAMDGYFTNADTDGKLVKEIIFSAVISVHGGREDSIKDHWVEMFKGCREKVRNVSYIEKSLSDFRKLYDQIADLVTLFEDLCNINDKLEAEEAHLYSYYLKVFAEKENMEEYIKMLQDELEKLNNQLNDMIWEEQSVGWYEVSLEIQSLKEKLYQKQTEVNDAAKALRLEKETLNKQKVLYQMPKIEEYENQIYKLETQINNRYKTKEELYNKFKVAATKYYHKLLEKIEAYQKRYEATELEKKECEDNYNHLSQKIKELRDKRDDYIQVKSKKEQDIERYNEKKEELRKKEYALEQLKCPEGSIVKLNDLLAKTNHQIENISESISDLEKEKENYNTKLNSLERIKGSLEPIIDNLDKELSKIYKEKDALEDQFASMLDLEKVNILENHQEILGEVQNQYEKIKHNKDKIITEIANDQEIQKLYDRSGIYIPNEGVSEIAEFLRKKDISFWFGSEWLINQDEKTKKRILEKNPLVGYGLIVDEKDMKYIKNLRLEKIINSPVPIFKKSDVNIEGVSIVSHYGIELFSDPDKLLNYINNINNKISQNKEKRQKFEETEKELNRLQFSIDSFVNENTPETIKKKEKELKEKKEELNNTEKEIANVFNSIENTKNNIDKNKSELDVLKESKEKYKTSIKDLEDFSKLHKIYIKSIKEKDEIIKEIEAIKKQIEETETKKEEVNDKKYELETSLTHIQNEKKELEKELDEVSTNKNDEVYDVSSEEFSQLKQEYRSLEESFNKGVADIEQLKKSLNYCRDSLNGQIGRVKELNYSLEEAKRLWEEHSYKKVSDYEVEQQSQKVAEAINKHNELKEAKEQIENSINEKNGVQNEKENQIFNTFGKKPKEFTDTDIENIVAEIKEKKSKIRSKINEYKTETEKHQVFCGKLDTEINKIENYDDIEKDEIGLQMLSEEEWKKYKEELDSGTKIARRLINELNSAKENRNEAKQNLDKEISKTRQLRKDDAQLFSDFVDKICGLLNQEQESDEYKKDKLREYLMMIDRKIENFYADKNEIDQEINEVKDEIVEELSTINKLIGEIEDYSKLGQKKQKTIFITYPEWDKEIGGKKIYEKIKEYIKLLNEEESSGKLTKSEVHKKIENMLDPAELFNIVCPFGKFEVKIKTPVMNKDLDSEDSYKLGDKIPWNHVVGFSGAQKYTSYFFMYVSMLIFIRRQLTNKTFPGTTLLADNPFGTTSADDNLSAIFDLANENNIQLLCFSGLKDSNIFKHFPVSYSMKLEPEFSQNRLVIDEARRIDLSDANVLSGGGYRKG
ncbi:hypothetical protein [Natranaerofaba carboxydovora]|uniref:hypothetical protein n=1 Tax=Natranaerofaba carboxydovora TaxID=2742683 RepID=UPI001F137DE3|nr:hypothetical protein [Natranaerofaba carboxydovora]UMZ74680.1 SMC_prok_B: chromosome segregation protein SMC [Natranaerofaba carboxydovora]